MFNWDEVETLVCGKPEVDVDLLEVLTALRRSCSCAPNHVVDPLAVRRACGMFVCVEVHRVCRYVCTEAGLLPMRSPCFGLGNHSASKDFVRVL